MNIRRRTIISLAVPFVIMVGLLSLLFQTHLLTNFESLEESRLNLNVNRALLALENFKQRQLLTTVDWAQFDETYEFIVGKNEDFNNSMLNYDTVASLQVRDLIFFNLQGELVASVNVDATAKSTQSTPSKVIEEIRGINTLFSYSKAEDTSAAVIRLAGDISVVTAVPIMDSARQKEPRGLLVFVQPVTDELINKVGKQTQLEIVKQDVALSATWDPRDQSALERTKLIDGPAFVRASDSVMNGYGLVRDIHNEPVMLLKLPQDRDIYRQGLAVRNFLVGSLVLSTLLAICVVLFLFNRKVLKRLKVMSAKISNIAVSRDFSERVAINGKDELTSLASDVNQMLDALGEANETTQQALFTAEQANLSKSTFMAKVSHELRTPIHSILGMLRILLKEEASDGKRSYINMASNSAYGLLETINEILDFSKAEAGKLTIENVPMTLRSMIDEALRTIAPRIEEKEGLELVYDIPSEIPDEYIGDPHRLKQCLLNLLGNAAKFTPKGSVSLLVDEVKRDSDRITLSFIVSDTGIGIPSERLDKIFDPFTQADDSVTRLYSGTGLGLTIVKQSIELMGGSVSVYSEVGVGTTFTITVPIRCTDMSVREIELPTLRVSKVAIIDGDDVAPAVLAQTLPRYGLQGELFKAHDRDSIARLDSSLSEYGLLVVTSEAIKSSSPFDLVVRIAIDKEIPLLVILSPFEISLRERLTALSVPYIISRPVSAEQLLLCVSGSPQASTKTWKEDAVAALSQTRNLRILIADDALTNRIILTNLLEDAGHTVTACQNGMELLDILKPIANGEQSIANFDVVLTDIQMPLLDGVSATKMVREIEKSAGRGGRIPIVAVTAHAMSEEAEAMKQAGIDEVITKPIEPKRLADVVRRFSNGTSSNAAVSCVSATPAPDIIEDPEKLSDLVCRIWRQLEVEENLKAHGLSHEEISADRMLDLKDVYERVGESTRRMRLILNAFLDCFREQLSRLMTAKNSASPGELRSVAHALKGLLLDVGAKQPSELASLIEQMCKDGRSQEGFKLVTLLSHQVLVTARLIERATEALSQGIEVASTEDLR
jgi:signal transduction histidine kinase/CheY-like chemotaxis protein